MEERISIFSVAGAMPSAMKPFKSNVDRTVPEGTYHLRVHRSEYVGLPKKPGASPYIKTWLVISAPDGPCLGRMVFANYPLEGNGRFRLEELLAATNHEPDFELTDPDELLNLEFMALVMVEPATSEWPAKNVIKKHMPLF